MIQSDVIRLVHRPELSYPWILQMQNHKGVWVFHLSFKNEDAAKRKMMQIDRKRAYLRARSEPIS